MMKFILKTVCICICIYMHVLNREITLLIKPCVASY